MIELEGLHGFFKLLGFETNHNLLLFVLIRLCFQGDASAKNIIQLLLNYDFP